jgi:hypothetical protein
VFPLSMFITRGSLDKGKARIFSMCISDTISASSLCDSGSLSNIFLVI